MLLPPSEHAVVDAAVAPTRSFWLDVNAEDIDIVGRSQRGLARGRLPPGPLAPRFEEPLHRFHNMLADHMTSVPVRIPDGDRPSVADDRRGAAVNPMPPAIDSRAVAVSEGWR